MLNDKDSVRATLLIDEVREATFDPVLGEHVLLALKVVSPDRAAATGVAVTFVIERGEEVSVITDADGWASYTYTADALGEVAVSAKLTGFDEPVHTFPLKVLAAGFWDGAMFQFGTSAPVVWGTEAAFPRTSGSHTVWFKTESAPLLGRQFCLGLTGYSSATELGLTVVPPLGEYRALPTNGELRWDFSYTGSKGGAYGLKLASPLILKHSPMNVMSLAPEGSRIEGEE
ncbi:hypothetical protein [Pseudomonas sp. SWRI154]|uniref:hypothetical protein n=1 Tax=Pseudomonas sp. SWRI154 TaxID=2745501 RepID=UPI0016459D12|nr:hypothetical protein [Pseudomonas sp. SWRI154]MBC3363963.1 hypothetical protein [Pseudomonas sp. SWRI154]